MKPTNVHTIWIVLGTIFMSIGIVQGRNAFTGAGVVFFAIGFGLRAKARRQKD